jgi:hypothetical protein
MELLKLIIFGGISEEVKKEYAAMTSVTADWEERCRNILHKKIPPESRRFVMDLMEAHTTGEMDNKTIRDLR